MAQMFHVWSCLAAVVVGVSPPAMMPPPVKPAVLPANAVFSQASATNAGMAAAPAVADISPAQFATRLRGQPPLEAAWKQAENVLTGALESKQLTADDALREAPESQLGHQVPQTSYALTSSIVSWASPLGAIVAAALAAGFAGGAWWTRRSQAVKNKEFGTEMTASSSLLWSTLKQPKLAVAALGGESVGKDAWSHCAAYKDELLSTVKALTMPGKGILAADESNGTCGLRLASINVDNTEENRVRWRELLLGTKNLGDYCGGAILFTETLYQNTSDGKKMVDLAKENGVVPGIKVDTGLVPLVGGKEGEVWCRGLDDLKERTEKFYEAGARFAKWRTVVRVRDHSELAVREAAHGLARYASICQSSGLVPIIEPEILLDGEHDIEECLVTFEETWSEVFKACADFGVQLEAVLLKPSMVTPGAQSGKEADAQTIASYTLGALKRVVPPAVPGIMFLSGGQSEVQATLNLNAMNQSPNPWHVSFSYARALQNTTLKTWAGDDANKVNAQAKLFQRAQANSKAQLGKYDPATADEDASAAEGMYVKDYVY